MERLEMIDPDLAAIASMGDAAAQRLVARASRLAVEASGLADASSGHALGLVEEGQMDASVATEARGIADELDAAAWTAQEADDEASYFRLFRRARAASALALGGEYGDAIYEAAYAFEAPEDLLRLLRDVPDDQPT